MPLTIRPLAAALGLLLSGVLAAPAQAQLFGDDQARQAILELRERFDQSVHAQNRLVEENTQLRRSMLELQQQLAELREQLAEVRGQSELFEQQLSEQQQGGTLDALDERLRRLEVGTWGMSPAGEGSGRAENADVRQAYDQALDTFRAGDFATAQTQFAAFIKQHPSSSLAPLALFWLGNAQYATRNYQEAITNFRSLLAAVPDHPKAPDALLSIANCQTELGDKASARESLQTLIQQHPDAEAAQTARERLQRLN